MSAIAIADGIRTHGPRGSLGALAIGALGVVYSDIGTSPLYTLKTALDWGGGATPEVAIGMLSLIAWTLLITTSIKYVAVVMRPSGRKARDCVWLTNAYSFFGGHFGPSLPTAAHSPALSFDLNPE
jgi:K+ potassium transporter